MRATSCGVDLVEISRIARALQRQRFRERVFTSRERAQLADKQPQSWAGRFAAKEAVMKALGTGWSRGRLIIGDDHLQTSNSYFGGRALEVSHSWEYRSIDYFPQWSTMPWLWR